MDISIFLAKIFGVYLLAGSVAIFMRKDKIDDVMHEFMNNSAMQLFGGAIALILGLLLVNIHNIWIADWPVIITIISWGSLIKGILFMISPKTMGSIAKSMISGSMLTVSSIVMFVCGAWLTYIAYLV